MRRTGSSTTCGERGKKGHSGLSRRQPLSGSLTGAATLAAGNASRLPGFQLGFCLPSGPEIQRQASQGKGGDQRLAERDFAVLVKILGEDT